jgi:arginine-tRNA-protein transferase
LWLLGSYLGYWVEGSSRMAYKTAFRPLERLGRDGWRRMGEEATETGLSEPIALPTRRLRSRLLIDA